MKRHLVLIGLLGALCSLFITRALAGDRPIVVGSKKDTEGRVVGEIVAQFLEGRGFRVERRLGLGGTLICFAALTSGEIDLYPEYSGTIEQAILKLDHRTATQELVDRIRDQFGMELLPPFGFNNTYAIAVGRKLAKERGLVSIADLARVPDLTFGFSHEFLNRTDGWPGLARIYGLTVQPLGIEHGLAYQAMREGKISVTDAYSTDGELLTFDLVLLRDDRHYFPQYLAAPLVKKGVSSEVTQALTALAGMIDDAEMQRLNARAEKSHGDFALLAREFLTEKKLQHGVAPINQRRWHDLLRRTLVHLRLTAIALAAAILVAIPLGIAIYRLRAIARPALYLIGTLQTIPSIALLAFMIPLFGVGAVPAIIALFLYALLPIVRNTTAALLSVDPLLKEVSLGMGLTVGQRLRHVELPLALPLILAGIRTAAVISIGTATLAAFIGAGGLGEPIVTGLALNDPTLILEGAIPASLLAILTELGFELLESVTIPAHLKT